MKLFTLILAASFLTSTAGFSQTSYINMKYADSAAFKGSIKFNPLGIANGVVKVKMYNQPEGNYSVSVMDSAGNVVAVREITHANGSSIETADFGKTFAGGTYNIEVVSPDNTKTDQTLMLLM